jgi:hypothetical protein
MLKINGRKRNAYYCVRLLKNSPNIIQMYIKYKCFLLGAYLKISPCWERMLKIIARKCGIFWVHKKYYPTFLHRYIKNEGILLGTLLKSIGLR